MVELLTVCALVAMLTGLLVPAFSNLQKSNSLNMSGNLVANLANLARENSMSKNTMTALVMLTDPGSDGRARAFVLMECVPSFDGPAEWKEASKWESLSAGIIADQCTFRDSSEQPSVPLPPIKYGGKEVASYKYALFLPGGGLNSGSPPTIRMVPGFYPPNSSTPSYTTPNEGAVPAQYYQITILDATGRIKIDRP